MLRLRAMLPLAVVTACARPEAATPRPPPPVAPSSATPRVPPQVGVDRAMLRTARLEPGDPELKCSDDGYHRARCLQARAHPEVRFFWMLYWDELERDEQGNDRTRSPAEMQERRARVIARLRADGATQILDGTGAWSAWVIAPYPAIRGALMLPEVEHATVACDPDDQEFCACERLRVDQCPEHAFCQPVIGKPLDTEGRCMGPPTLAGCTRAELCSDATSRVQDPGGRQWLFPSSCRPDQPGWRGLGYSMHLPALPRDCPGV